MLRALQNGLYISPMPYPHQVMSQGTATLDAAGESRAMCGRIFLEGGTAGGSKTISSAGGKIHWRTGAVTFANGATTVDVGIQDLAATGEEDGTYDVKATLTGGGGGITGSALQSTAMDTGTKTIAHGDRIAIIVEMTARGGADSVTVALNASATCLEPYGTTDSGAGPAKTGTISYFTIEFDDGTVGWFHPFHAFPGTAPIGTASTAFGSGSTPDERAMIFSIPFPATISGAGVAIAAFADTDDFDVILYIDPLGTPTAVRTVSVDGDYTGETSSVICHVNFADYDLRKNVPYAIAVRPTTTNTLSTVEYAYGATNIMKPMILGANWYLGTRTDQSGAFATTLTSVPNMGLHLSKFHDFSPRSM